MEPFFTNHLCASPTTMHVVFVLDVSVEQLSQALEGKCRVLKLDSDEEEDMSSALNVSPVSVPGML